MDLEQRIFPVIFVTSSASLAFEVLLTRIYSISVSYHFAAMIVSIAMLGIAAAGVLLSLFPRLKEPTHLGKYVLALGGVIPASYLLVNRFPFDPVRLTWERTEILRIGFHYLALALPFLCAGLVIATAFAARSGRSGLIYGADLLGAATGSVGILILTSLAPPEQGVFLLSAFTLAASCLILSAPLRNTAIILALVSLTIFHLQPEFARLKISPYKGLEAALRYPGASPGRSYYSPSARVDTFKSPAVRFAPGLSLGYLEPLPEQTGIAVDGGDISAVTDPSDPARLTFLSFLPAALPYEAGFRGRVLVLDPRGGLHILLALRYGAGEVIGIESIPLLARVTAELTKSYPENRRHKILTGAGRSWLMGGNDSFDLIDISLQGSVPSAALGMAEEYRLTVEAFREYLRHLRSDGAICVNLFLLPPPRIELRVLATAATALEEMGVRDASRHIALLRSWGSVSIMVKRSPLSGAEVGNIRRFAGERRFDLVSLPGLEAKESNRFVRMQSDLYYRACAALLSPRARERFSAGYLFDITPVRDDAPFFNHFLRLDKVRETYHVMGGKWQFFLEEGYLYPAVLLQALLISALLVLVPAVSGGRSGDRLPSGGTPDAGRSVWTCRRGRRLLPYFALIGIGFMFAEIFLLQKMILPLGNATHALAAVLASLLSGSGAGSLLGERYTVLRRPLTLAAIALMVILYTLILPETTPLFAKLNPPLRFTAVFVVLVPLALPMGIPFPTGMRLLGERDPSLIPWAWAINGAFSVLAPLLALMIALAAGFGAVAFLAAASYFLAFLILLNP